MRKPKGFKSGNLAEVVFGKNLLMKKSITNNYMFGLYSSVPQKNVIVFEVNKPCTLEYSTLVPIGSVVLILEAKRTRVKQGAVPYFIILLNNKVYKIDASCIRTITN